MKYSYDALLKDKLPHDHKKILQHILVCRYCKNTEEVNKHRLLLLRRLSFIVTKQVENFYFLARNYRKEVFHTKDELVSECFLILNKCTNKFDWQKNKTNFYFYYNKSLSREMYRMFERMYLKQDGFVRFEAKHENLLKDFQDNNGFIEFYIDKVNLTDVEKRILESRMVMQKSRDFLKQNKDIPDSVFYEALQSIKLKFNFLKDGSDNKDSE